MSTRSMGIWIGCVIVVFVMLACGKGKQAENRNWVKKEAAPLLRTWEDRYNTAKNTPRLSLSGPLSDLKTTRRAWAELDAPEDLSRFHDSMEQAMGMTVDAMEMFMGQQNGAKLIRSIGELRYSASLKHLQNRLEEEGVELDSELAGLTVQKRMYVKQMVKTYEETLGGEGMQKLLRIQGMDPDPLVETLNFAREVYDLGDERNGS